MERIPLLRLYHFSVFFAGLFLKFLILIFISRIVVLIQRKIY